MKSQRPQHTTPIAVIGRRSMKGALTKTHIYNTSITPPHKNHNTPTTHRLHTHSTPTTHPLHIHSTHTHVSLPHGGEEALGVLAIPSALDVQTERDVGMVWGGVLLVMFQKVLVQLVHVVVTGVAVRSLCVVGVLCGWCVVWLACSAVGV